jgi:hypothetical protein
MYELPYTTPKYLPVNQMVNPLHGHVQVNQGVIVKIIRLEGILLCLLAHD